MHNFLVFLEPSIIMLTKDNYHKIWNAKKILKIISSKELRMVKFNSLQAENQAVVKWKRINNSKDFLT